MVGWLNHHLRTYNFKQYPKKEHYSFLISFTALILDQMSVLVIERCPHSGINLQFKGVFGRFTYMWKQRGFRLKSLGSTAIVLERSFTCVDPASNGLSLIPRPEESGNEASLGLCNQPNMNWYLFKKWLCVFQFFSDVGCYLFWRDTLTLGLQLLKERKKQKLLVQRSLNIFHLL